MTNAQMDGMVHSAPSGVRQFSVAPALGMESVTVEEPEQVSALASLIRPTDGGTEPPAQHAWLAYLEAIAGTSAQAESRLRATSMERATLLASALVIPPGKEQRANFNVRCQTDYHVEGQLKGRASRMQSLAPNAFATASTLAWPAKKVARSRMEKSATAMVVASLLLFLIALA